MRTRLHLIALAAFAVACLFGGYGVLVAIERLSNLLLHRGI
jgi:hypothetical protein